MKNRYSFFASTLVLGLLLIAGTAQAATLYSQSTTLSPGWNIVSTPKILASHSFSATENSTNFDIYALDPSKTSGWATLADSGGEFSPLYGYFVNNKTGTSQTLTFNYSADTTPNQRLFQRTFTNTGWYSFGVANPSYALSVGTATTTDTNNPSSLLSALVVGSTSGYDTVVDFTNASSSVDINAVALTDPWKAVVDTAVNTLNDLRETKGYAIYIKQANTLYSGHQDNTVPQCMDGIDNDGDGYVDYPIEPSCSSSFDNDESPTNGAPSLSVSISSTTPASQNVTPGTQAFHMANILLDATQSGEDIRMSSIKLTQTGTIAELSSCQLFSGSTAINTGSNVPSSLAASGSDTTFTFDNTLITTKGTVTTLALKCNISSSASGTHVWSISGTALSATGVTSGSSVNVNEVVGSGGTMTAVTGSITVSVDSSTPSYAPVAAGTTGVTLGVVKLRATNEAVTLNKLGLTLTNSGNTNSSASGGTTNKGVSDLVQVYLYDGSTLVGTATFTGTGVSATSTLNTPVTLPKDTDKLLTIKADLANIGVSSSGGVGDVIKVDPINAEGSGQSSGSTIKSGASTGVAGIQMFKSYPTITNSGVSCTNSNACNGTSQLIKQFKIAGNAAGPVGLYQITVKVATSSASVTNLKLFVLDSSCSNSVNVPNTTGGQYGSTAALGGTTDSANPTVNFVQTTPLQVPAGGTYCFQVRGDVTVGNATAWSIFATILGDAATSTSPAGYNANTATSVATSNFVWSDNASTTAAATDIDWFNGYFLPGLSSSGF